MQAQQKPSLISTQQNRLVISLIVLVLWLVIVIAGARLLTGDQVSLDDLVTQQIGLQLVAAVLLLSAVVYFFGWQREVGLRPAEPASSWRLLWLPALFVVGFLAFSILIGLPAPQAVIFVLINTLLVGIGEELMFRGILFSGLRSRLAIWPAILLTCLLFGLVHASNGFITGDFGGAVQQAVVASMSGLWLHAIRLRTKSLYPAMIIHWLWDFAVFMFSASSAGTAPQTPVASAALPSIIAPILLALPLVLYGLWLLRRIGKPEQ